MRKNRMKKEAAMKAWEEFLAACALCLLGAFVMLVVALIT